MKLLTKEIEVAFASTGSQDGLGEDAVIIVKFFDPCGSWTWYATEYDPATRCFFGLVDGHELEYGSFSLDELEAYKGPFGLGIERDLYFGKGRTLREVVLH